MVHRNRKLRHGTTEVSKHIFSNLPYSGSTMQTKQPFVEWAETSFKLFPPVQFPWKCHIFLDNPNDTNACHSCSDQRPLSAFEKRYGTFAVSFLKIQNAHIQTPRDMIDHRWDIKMTLSTGYMRVPIILFHQCISIEYGANVYSQVMQHIN